MGKGLQISAAFLQGLGVWALLVSKGPWMLSGVVSWAPTHIMDEAKPGLDQLKTDHWAGAMVYEPTARMASPWHAARLRRQLLPLSP